MNSEKDITCFLLLALLLHKAKQWFLGLAKHGNHLCELGAIHSRATEIN